MRTSCSSSSRRRRHRRWITHLYYVHQASFRLLGSSTRINRVNGEVIYARSGRQALITPVVGHPNDRDFTPIHLERLHSRCAHSFHEEITARRRYFYEAPSFYLQLVRKTFRHFEHWLRNELVQPWNVARRGTAAPVFSDGRRDQHIGKLLHCADRLMRFDARILEYRVVLHLRMQNVLYRTLNRLIHFRQWTVFRHVSHVPWKLRILCVGILINRGEK